ncbi:hypothetical protein E5288_WYG006245 [Bos mutus]|uniref:Uncharacterized protein n=1 Tax=Bos mutus TaxID=72004 RepID=A0A6B0QT27_9CETA|nr:hypothetical protein [Bos mutus]
MKTEVGVRMGAGDHGLLDISKEERSVRGSRQSDQMRLHTAPATRSLSGLFRDRIQSKYAASWAGRKRRVLRKKLDFCNVKERKRNSQAIAFGLGGEGSDFHIEESYSPRALVRYPLFVKVLLLHTSKIPGVIKEFDDVKKSR